MKRGAEQNDGFTMHYPGDTSNQRSRILDIVRSAYSYSGLNASFLPSTADGGVAALTESGLPVIACPQADLIVNGTTISS